MKYIKILTIIGIFGMLCSCTNRDYIPETGTAPVEFISNPDSSFSSALIYLPVTQVKRSNADTTATPVSIKILSCEAVNIANEPVTLEEDVDFMVTDKSIYVAPRDKNGVDTTTSFEIRVPGFQYYKSVTLTAELVGDYLATNRQISVKFNGPERYTLDGIFNLTYRDFQTLTMEEAVVEIVKDPEDLLTYYVRLFGEKEGGFLATREINTLKIVNTYPYSLDIGQGESPLFLVYCAFEDLTGDPAYGIFYPMPDATVPASFTFSSDTEFKSTGFCIGYDVPFQLAMPYMSGSAVRLQ